MSTDIMRSTPEIEWAGASAALEGFANPFRDLVSSPVFAQLEETRSALAAASGALMPDIKWPGLEVVEASVMQAAQVSAALEGFANPFRDLVSSPVFAQLEETRSALAAASGALMPDIDLGWLTPKVALTGATLSHLDPSLLDSLRERTSAVEEANLLDLSLREIEALWNEWDDVGATAEDAAATVGEDHGADPPSLAVGASVVLAALLVEARTSQVLLGFLAYGTESLIALARIMWQAASIPGVAMPLGTIASFLTIASHFRRDDDIDQS